MSKRSKIRWQDSDIQELGRAINNFNRKIDRIVKKNPELKSAMPEKIRLNGYTDKDGKYISGLKELINTRQDLKREINALKRFTDRKNVIDIIYDEKTKKKKYIGVEIVNEEYNTKVTLWQKKEINRRKAFINKRREERLKMIEETDVVSRGKELGYTRGHIGVGRTEILELQPLTGITEGANQQSIWKKYRSFLEQSQSDFYTLKDYRCKENYLTGLYNNFNETEIDEIARKVENMPIDEFLKIFNSDENAKFTELYKPTESERKKAVKTLKAVWLPNR